MSGFAVRTVVRNHGPIILFVFLTIVGSAVIWFGKLLDFDIATITAIPVAMMWLYLAVNMLPGIRVHSEQAGDNLYYMGFVFTLTSLGVSLYKFTGEASIEDVVRNFGIAIISTVMGIALRIFFNQMRRDPADIEKAVRHELAEMTRRVRSELDNSAMEFSTYRRTSNQMLSEGFEEIARQAEKNGEAVRSAIEAMSTKAVESIEATSKQLLSTLEHTHRDVAQLSEVNAKNVLESSNQLEKVASLITEKSGELAKAIDDVVEKYKAAKSPDDIIRIDVASAVDSLKSVVDTQAKAIGENSADTRETAKKILAALGPFKQTTAAMNKASTEMRAAAEAQIRSVETMDGLAVQIGGVIGASEAANKLHATEAAKLSELVESTSKRNEEARLAEAQARSRSERIEVAVQNLGRLHTVQDKEPTAEEPALPMDLGEPIIINAPNAEEDKPRRLWWQR